MNREIPLTARRYVEGLLARGRHTFTREEAGAALGGNSAAVYMALHRLSKAGWIAMPRAGFYVIVDPPYREQGLLPASWFVHGLMAHMGRPYYVGLMSAAEIHGAAHQKPMVFQVVVPRRAVRRIGKGGVRIWFYGKGPFDASALQDVKTTTGYIKVSTPETTAWDIVRFPHASGGLDNVVTILSELSERLDAKRLADTARRHGDRLVARRLGFLLDRLGHRDLTPGLARFAAKSPLRLLDPRAPAKGSPWSRKWNLLANAPVEPEA